MSVTGNLINTALRPAWARFLHLWKPMMWWTLLSWLLIAVILVPLTTAMLSSFVFRGDHIMIANEDILTWLLNPVGITYLVITAGLTIIGAVFRFAGLFHILSGVRIGKDVSVQQVLYNLLPDLPALFRLCIKSAGTAILVILPLLVGPVLCYLIWLTDHDINYYLYAQPAEWQYALIGSGIWAALWGISALYLLLRSLPALPAFLDGHRPVRSALKKSWECTRGQAAKFLWLLLICLLGWFLLRLIAQSAIFLGSAFLVDAAFRYFESVTPVLLATGFYALITFTTDIIISFIGFSVTAIVLIDFYFNQTGLHQQAPKVTYSFSKLPSKTAANIRKWLQPIRSLPVLLFLFVAGAGVSFGLIHQIPEERSFTVTAHRAGMFLGPENTLYTLERAIETGADYAEIDVLSTRDDELIVVHDADLKRLTGDPRNVAEVRYDEIADLVQGGDQYAHIPDEERRIATLDQFLERSKDRIKLNIEPKYYGPDPGLAPKLVERVRHYGMEDQVIIMSFNRTAVDTVRQLAPDIKTGYLATVAFGNPTRLPVDFLAVPLPIASEAFIRSAHQRGLEVHVWTLNTAGTILQAAQRGADSIITDDPELAIRIREELEALTPAERVLLSFRPHLDL